MKYHLLLLSVFALNSLDCMFIEFEYNCDFQFGSPTWNYSKVFFDRDYYMNPYETYFEAFLQKGKGQMISFVCVNLNGTPKENAIVDFVSLQHKVKVNLTHPEDHEIHVHIVAKEHGY